MSRPTPAPFSTTPIPHGQPLEPLEPRRLLSSTLDPTGVLTVRGRAIADRILVREEAAGSDQHAVVVEIDSPLSGVPPTHERFPFAAVRSVLVRAGAGHDLVDLAIATYAVPALAGTRGLTLPARVDANMGNDTAIGGAARDLLLGGTGNDRLLGLSGHDRLDGQRGHDFLSGGADNDVLWGGLDHDTLYGDFGNDTLYGGHGNDHLGSSAGGPLPPEPGNDLLSGGYGNDTLFGGDAKDRIAGGPGLDTFSTDDHPSEWFDKQPDEPAVTPPPVV